MEVQLHPSLTSTRWTSVDNFKPASSLERTPVCVKCEAEGASQPAWSFAEQKTFCPCRDHSNCYIHKP